MTNTQREIINSADRLTDEETQAIRNNAADFLAQVQSIRNSATNEQFAKFLAKLDEDSRNLARRFFNEMQEFFPRYSSPKQKDSAPSGKSTND